MPCILTFSSLKTQAVNGEKTEKLIIKYAFVVETISESWFHCVATPSNESSCTDISRDTCNNSNIVSACSKQNIIIS